LPRRDSVHTAPTARQPVPASETVLRSGAGRCACGGGCPRCSCTGSSAYERAAERAATAIAPTLASPAPERRAVPLPLLPTRPSTDSKAFGPGQELPRPVRAPLEDAFGFDLRNLRIHDGPAAHAAAREFNAEAFSAGPHIGFAHGRSGDTGFGRHLLAHETAHAVQSALDPAAPPIQRYEAAEHQRLGDDALDELVMFLGTAEGIEWAKKNGLDAPALIKQIEADPLKAAGGTIKVGSRATGPDGATRDVRLTPGQIIAIAGDFYRSPEAITKAAGAPAAEPDTACVSPEGSTCTPDKRNELARIADAIRDEAAGKLADPNAFYEELTGGRFLKLAKKNETHFAPLNRAEWRRLHEQALAEAKVAGWTTDKATKDEKLQSALLADAAGSHFLTDAYAGGHLFNRLELMDAITRYLMANSVVTPNPEVQAYAGLMTATDNMPSLLLKSIHDRMNHEGFDVENGKKMKWKTFGDTVLSKAPDTARIASLAVFASRQQVYQVFRDPFGTPPDPAEIEAYMPDDATVKRATEKAIKYIPDAARDVQNVMYRGRNLAATQFPPLVGDLIKWNLGAIAAPGRANQVQLWDEMNRQHGLPPTPAPQFQIAEWDL
jgi:hypothetical protein